jgi:phosphate transport system substrate-binding protein
MHKKLTLLAVLLTGIFILSITAIGCTGGQTTTVTKTNTVTAAPDQTKTTTETPKEELSGTITTAGSTTVQPLAEKLAEQFMTIHPKVSIIIQGGGSSVGVKSANDGTVDIGHASRELKSSEPDLVTHILARDGIAVVVHPDNQVSELTTEQVRQIFAGEINNWSQVGGDSEEIHVVAREEGSGTRAAFQEMVMGDDLEISKTAILQSSNGAIMQVVKDDSNSIGFVSFGYLNETVKAIAIDDIKATVENAKSATYPIVRPLYFLTKDEPDGLVKAFIDFCLSAESQETVEEEGYISVY